MNQLLTWAWGSSQRLSHLPFLLSLSRCHENSDPENSDLRPQTCETRTPWKNSNSSQFLSPKMFSGHAMFIGNWFIAVAPIKQWNLNFLWSHNVWGRRFEFSWSELLWHPSFSTASSVSQVWFFLLSVWGLHNIRNWLPKVETCRLLSQALGVSLRFGHWENWPQ